MKHKITVINPTPRKKIKRLKSKRRRKGLKRKRATVLKNKSLTIKKGVQKVATKRKAGRPRKRKRAKKNPGAVSYPKRKRSTRRGGFFKSRRRRARRNPEVINTNRPLDLLQVGGGMAGGGISMPYLANILQLEGMTRFGFGLVYAVALYYIVKKFMPKAALPAAAAAGGVATFELIKDKGILAGLGNDDLTADDIERLNLLREGVEGVGAVYPQLGAVYPGVGANVFNGGSIKVHESAGDEFSEYTDSQY